jgi:hypothetical protein
MTILGRVLAYRRPLQATVASVGLFAAAPASISFLLATLVVSVLWHDPPGGHRLVDACCAWRATNLPRGPLLPLLGSALLVRRPVEAIWTTTAAGLVLGPLEAVVGSRRLIALGVLGHALPTILVDLCWLVTGKAGQGLDGLDVGTSAVVVAAAAALAVTTRSLPVAAVLVASLTVDIAAAPDLATTEHLIAVAIGVSLAMAFSRERRRATAPSDSTPVDATTVELTTAARFRGSPPWSPSSPGSPSRVDAKIVTGRRPLRAQRCPVAAIPDGGGQQPGPRDRHLRDPAARPSAVRLLVALRAAAGVPLGSHDSESCH